MGGNIHLDRAFTQGHVEVVRATKTVFCRPPKGSCWLVLSGIINHGNGTTTRATIRKSSPEGGGEAFWNTEIDTSLANGFYPLFLAGGSITIATGMSMCNIAAFVPLILDDDDEIMLSTGDNAAFVQCHVLEWSKI